MDPFVAAVGRTIRRRQMLAPGDRCLVALSGGADSVALLAVLKDLGWPLAAAHFNHGWRGDESRRDEEFARALAAELGVELAVERAAAEERAPGGREQAARASRYRFLERARGRLGCARVATGHTRDDQAETVLLRLLRGSGATGLAGIRPLRADGVVRPLLDVGRADVLGYLERRGLGFVEDSSNAGRDFLRNRLRHDVLPLLRTFNPRLAPALGRLADEMAAVGERERTLALEILGRALDGGGGLVLAALDRYPASVGRLVVRAWLESGRGDLRRLGATHVDAVAACGRSGTGVDLPGGQRVVNEHGILRLAAAAAAAGAAPAALALAPGGCVHFGGVEITASVIEAPAAPLAVLPDGLGDALLDADRAVLPLTVRAWRAGDRVRPLGMRGQRKLSDVFIDAKVPRWRRATLPVVESDGAILWVPGLVRGIAGAVGAGTLRVVRLRARGMG